MNCPGIFISARPRSRERSSYEDVSWKPRRCTLSSHAVLYPAARVKGCFSVPSQPVKLKDRRILNTSIGGMSGCPPQRTMTGYRLASPPPYAKLGYAPYWSPDQDAQACVATAAWMTAILQPSTRRSRDVHCHEPLPGEEGIRTGVREGVAQPRFAAEQGAGLRRIPPAEGTRARRLHALCVAYGLAERE